jgi:hypothetical protein
MGYKTKKRNVKAVLDPDRYDLYVEICKKKKKSKVKITTGLVEKFIDKNMLKNI